MLVNGKEITIKESQSLESFLLEHNYKPLLVAVELNGNIVKQKDFSNTQITAADTLEIVSFVGGG